MLVKLTYFKNYGKYYSQGEYQTELEELFEIFEEVAKMSANRVLPGLVENHSYYHVLIDVPDHKYNHPALIPIHTVI